MPLHDPIQIIEGHIQVGVEIPGLIGENFFDETPDVRGPLFGGNILFHQGTEQNGPHLVVGPYSQKGQHTGHFGH